MCRKSRIRSLFKRLHHIGARGCSYSCSTQPISSRATRCASKHAPRELLRVTLLMTFLFRFLESPTTGIFTLDGVFCKLLGKRCVTSFVPVFYVAAELALQQIQSSKSPDKTVPIASGSGRNQFLRRCLREKMPPGITVLAPSDDWTAVVRAALAKVLSRFFSSGPKR